MRVAINGLGRIGRAVFKLLRRHPGTGTGRGDGLRKAMMNTVHAYTASQGLVDGPNHKMRRGRAGAANLVPSTTGAATATTRALPALRGRFQGTAVRAPVAICSLCDVVMLTERATSVDEVNALFLEEARSERYEGVVGVTEDPVVSSDIIQDPAPRSSTAR